jgi:hypothetical protein
MGAKPTNSVQLAPPSSCGGHPFVSVKSPEIAVESAKELALVFCTVMLCVVLDRPVTMTGVVKFTLVVETLRLGLVEFPVTLAGGSVVPVRRTLRP